MSSLAVFLVLGGGAFAATQLPKNSVGAKQLKKNAVTTAKIKKDAVTGAKVKEATLGPVPSAESIPPAEATHLVGAPGEPPFENGSQNFPGIGSAHFEPVGFYKDHEGIVHLQGIAAVGKSSGGVASIFTLPAGFRPAPGALILHEEINESVALIAGSNTNIEGLVLDGKVIGNEEEAAVLDGITFRAQS
jgi:hypothetical protein